MTNFIFGVLVVGVILYFYLRTLKIRRDAEIEKRRVMLDRLKQSIDLGGESYQAEVAFYNSYVTANADILRKYGIDPTPIQLQHVVKDVRSGKFVDITTGHVVDASGGRLATITAKPDSQTH